MSTYDRLGALVPDGYEVRETDDIVPDSRVEFYPLRMIASARRRELNREGVGPLHRYDVERVSPRVRALVTSLPAWPQSRWAFVAKQNVLRKRGEA